MLSITLIGLPYLARDGQRIPGPRGAKTWALLARVLRSPDRVSRQQLVSELFPEADDPMGALRWTLAELRRRLGMPQALRGNPIEPNLDADTEVDVWALTRGFVAASPSRGVLLEGVDPAASASFETWLLVERQRVAAELLGVLRRETLKALSGGDAARAVLLAKAMVDTAPLEEGPHVLLCKALVDSGEDEAAARHVHATDRFFRAELGMGVGEAVRAAARPPLTPTSAGVSSIATARSLLTAGLSALAAGAADVGIERLRAAVAASEGGGSRALEGECLFELGTALVHAARGFDDEGTVLLDAAHTAALEAGDRDVAAKATAELAYVDVLYARRECAVLSLEVARTEAAAMPRVLASVAAYEAVHLSDWGRLDQAIDRFDEAIDLCRETGSVRRGIWAMACAARTAYLAGWVPAAERWAKESIREAFAEKWTAIRPWPEAWLAHARLAKGEAPSRVRADLEPTYALARQLQDPCWEGVAAKAMALTFVAEGEPARAMPWLESAGSACMRLNDSYKWVEVDVAVTSAEVAQRTGDTETALAHAERALRGAARGDMPLLLARAEAVIESLRAPVAGVTH